MKKQTFRPHYVLAIEGRIFAIFLPSVLSLMLFMFAKFAIVEKSPIFIVFTCFTITAFVAAIWVLHNFWHLFWGKLTVNQEFIQWRCLLCKPQTIAISEIKSFRVCAFVNGNVYRSFDLYRTGHRYVVISKYPELHRPKKGQRIKSGNGVISFPYDARLHEALEEILPTEFKANLYQVLSL